MAQAAKSREPETPKKLRSGSDISPAMLPPAHVIEPTAEPHSGTLVILHGFTSSGETYAAQQVPKLTRTLGRRTELARLRLVYLNAPQRRITCYRDAKTGQRPKLQGWHDYYTDHGGSEGRPEVEEEVDRLHVEWTRKQVHKVLDQEAARLGHDFSRLALVGESQGSCCALDCALTYRKQLGGVFCSIGQRYEMTPAPPERKALPIYTFNGAADRCIAPSLALRSYAALLDAGYSRMRMHIQPGLGHEGSSAAESQLLASALSAWGLLEPIAPKEGGPSPKEGGPSPKEGTAAPKANGAAPKEGGPSPKAGGPSPKEGGPSPKEAGAAAPKANGAAPKANGAAPEAKGDNTPREAKSGERDGGSKPTSSSPAEGTPKVVTPKEGSASKEGGTDGGGKEGSQKKSPRQRSGRRSRSNDGPEWF